MNDLKLEGKHPCPACREHFSISIDSISNKGICEKCDSSFFFVLCSYCQNIIYFNEKIFIDGYYIKCPYSICGMMNCFIWCDRCNKSFILRKPYREGSPINCVHCNKVIRKIKCPYQICSNNPIELDKDYIFGQRLSCNHINGEKMFFQKLQCYFCYKNLVWSNNKGKKYIEGQPIICPYENCGKKMNSLTCRRCNAYVVFKKGKLELGMKIKCQISQCKNVFNVCFCPLCFTLIYRDGQIIEGETIICPNIKCKISFQFINCCFCGKPNFWLDSKNLIYTPSQRVKCSCGKTFIKMKCPHCGELIVSLKGIILLGKKYNCLSCKKEFALYYCSQCETNNMVKYDENSMIKPWKCNKCYNFMPSIQCPFCFLYGKCPNKKIGTEGEVICPYKDCLKTFYYYKCFICKKDFTDKLFRATDITCIHCRQKFGNNQCPQCKTITYYIQDNEKMEVDSYTCEVCQKTVIDNKVERTLPKIDLLPVNFSEGITFIYDQPEPDENEIKIEKALVKSAIYQIDPQKIIKTKYQMMINQSIKQKTSDLVENNTKCVICMLNNKISVFVPCGHRCACYECAKTVYNKLKKCPLCRDSITDMIPKVIDD